MQLMRGYKKWKKTHEKRTKATEQAQSPQRKISKDVGDGLRKVCKDFYTDSCSIQIRRVRLKPPEILPRRGEKPAKKLLRAGMTGLWSCEGKPILCAIAGGLFASLEQWESITSKGETLSDRMALLYREFSANTRSCDSAYKLVERISKANSSRAGRELEALKKALFPLVDIVLTEWDGSTMRLVKGATNNPKCTAVLFLARRGRQYMLLGPSIGGYLLPRSKVPAYLYA